MAAVCLERQQAARTAPRLFVDEPEGGCPPDGGCPLFLALHGNGSNARLTLAGWRPVLAAGWLLAVPQSSQGVSMDSYVWNDQEIAQREVAEHYATVTAKHTVDTGRAVLAGFSMGGETALRAALVGTVPVRGFILLGPGGPTIDTPDAWLPLLAGAAGRGLRGYILLGENDASIPHDAIWTLVDHLNAHGIPCALEVIPIIRHEYPADFAPYLERALAFVEQT
jgi:dienelactone hydrolase